MAIFCMQKPYYMHLPFQNYLNVKDSIVFSTSLLPQTIKSAMRRRQLVPFRLAHIKTPVHDVHDRNIHYFAELE